MVVVQHNKARLLKAAEGLADATVERSHITKSAELVLRNQREVKRPLRPDARERLREIGKKKTGSASSWDSVYHTAGVASE